MKIAILGFDVEGRASYEYFAAGGHELEIRDQNPELVVPADVASTLGPGYLDNLDRFDLLVRTAGLPPRRILEKNPAVGSKITSHINEFLTASPTRRVIGVTGTKGKGTTSTLIARMLAADGYDVQLGGNIGMPPLIFLEELTPESWVVLELSSFQLIDLHDSPHIGVCLMVVPEHLNWHADLDEYVTAKSRLFARQAAEDVAIYFADNDVSRQIADAGLGQKLPYYAPPGAFVEPDQSLPTPAASDAIVTNGAIVIDGQTICRTDELRLLGRHNWQNACAAVTAAWQVTQDVAAPRSVLTTFTGLPHRIEYVREIDGVRYYDDSYSTGLDATKAAVEAIDSPKVMILGGYDRMIDLEHFGEFALSHQADFRTLLLIGASAERLAEMLERAGCSNYLIDKTATTMPAIVAKARSLAQAGDAVVLSPGFASFDLFKNFTDRGEQFKAAVNKL